MAAADYCVECHMEKRPVAGIAHSNDTKHRIVRFPGQPLPDVAFEQPKPDLPGLLWMNRPAGEAGDRMPDLAQLQAYFTSARRDPSLWPLWFRKLNELSKTRPTIPPCWPRWERWRWRRPRTNAQAARDFALAMKNGSEEPITFLNLATALENLGRGQEAEGVLEKGVAAYPYSDQLRPGWPSSTRWMAAGKARKLVDQYRAVFPEDAWCARWNTWMKPYLPPLTASGKDLRAFSENLPPAGALINDSHDAEPGGLQFKGEETTPPQSRETVKL